MPDRVFIAVDDGVAAADLTRCLGRHGLNAELVRDGAGWQVEVRSLGKDPRSFFADLGVALARWNELSPASASHGRPLHGGGLATAANDRR